MYINEQRPKSVPYKKLKSFSKILDAHIMGDETLTQDQIDFTVCAMIDIIIDFYEQSCTKYNSLSDEDKLLCDEIDKTREKRLLYDFGHGTNGGEKGTLLLQNLYDGIINRTINQKNRLLDIISEAKQQISSF